MRRALAPLLAGLLGLTGALGVTLFLYRSAQDAVRRVLEERLRGSGETAAGLLGRMPPTPQELRAVMRASDLEGAYVVSPALEIVADATGPSGGMVSLLRVDEARVRRAFAGEASVAFAYSLEDQPIATGYFPVRAPDGTVAAVLAVEAGQSFTAARDQLRRALGIGVALCVVVAVALGAAALQWVRTEAHRRETAARAARGDAVARMAAMVAHEIRNPLGTIRGAAELVQARAAALGPADVEALQDVVEEVDRLRHLTQDFLDLAREPALATAAVDLTDLAAEAGRALAHRYPAVAIRQELPSLRVEVDARRIGQVLSNLLVNAAQAGAREIALQGGAADGFVRVEVRDDGPGIPSGVRARLFEPFTTGRAEGTGLGLAIARRIVERHGGTLTLVEDGHAGAAFALRLPLAAG